MNRQPTEADLEAAIDGVLQHAFPALTQSEIKHQTTFRIRLGHSVFEVGGGLRDWAGGRCDILLLKNDRPLAVLELKRDDLPLTDEDCRQGLSYARLTDPWAPLVIISNGKETRILETYTGRDWTPAGADETALAGLFKQAGGLAAADLRNAVETLLGPGSSCWVPFVRRFTKGELEKLTGGWHDVLAPFPKGMCFPRKAATAIDACLTSTDCVPFVVGPPLSGKSNVLREFAIASEKSPRYTVLYVDADSSAHGLFRTVANLLAERLDWQFSEEQVRAWLRRISHAGHSPSLVLMVDGGNPALLKPELDELVSPAYGRNLRLVVAIDDGALDSLVLSASKRRKTALGRRAAVTVVTPLDDDEFERAAEKLGAHRIAFFAGSQRAAEYRVPWLLRAVISLVGYQRQYVNENSLAVLPSVPGVLPLGFAKQRFEADDVLRGQFLRIAEAILDDADDSELSLDARLLSTTAFVCRVETLQRWLAPDEITAVVSGGYLKHALVENDRLLVPQLPAFVAASVGQCLARRLLADLGDVKTAVDRFVNRCAKLPFGDCIGGQALLEAAYSNRGLPGELAGELLAKSPKREAIPVGARFATLFGDRRVDGEVGEGGKLLVEIDGRREEIEGDPNEPFPRTHGGMTAWLILSHLARIPTAMCRTRDNAIVEMLNEWILVEVGCCPSVLRQPAGGNFDRLKVHELNEDTTVVCHEEGIIEPITQALMDEFARDHDQGDRIIAEAKRRESLPLLSRINIALLGLEGTNDAPTANWAARVRQEDVLPMFRKTLLDH